MQVDTWFLVVFILLLVAGPVTQLLQLIAPNLHHRLGLTEAKAMQPEFKWFLMDEKAIAIGDITYLAAGIAARGSTDCRRPGALPAGHARVAGALAGAGRRGARRVSQGDRLTP